MTLMTNEEQLARGIRAREILADSVFTDAFQAIEDEVIEQWKNSPARAEADREKLWTYLVLLQKLKACLTQTMDSGKLAALNIQHQQTVMDRLKAGWVGLTSETL